MTGNYLREISFGNLLLVAQGGLLQSVFPLDTEKYTLKNLCKNSLIIWWKWFSFVPLSALFETAGILGTGLLLLRFRLTRHQ